MLRVVLSVVAFPKFPVRRALEHAVGLGVLDGVVLGVNFTEGVDVCDGAPVLGRVVAGKDLGHVAAALSGIAHRHHLLADAILKMGVAGRQRFVVVLDGILAGGGGHRFIFYF